MSLLNMFLNMPTMVAVFMSLFTFLTYFIFEVRIHGADYNLLVLAYKKTIQAHKDACMQED